LQREGRKDIAFFAYLSTLFIIDGTSRSEWGELKNTDLQKAETDEEKIASLGNVKF